MALQRSRPGNLGIEVLPLIELAMPEPGEALLKERHAEIAEAISTALRSSLDNPSRLHGWQTQYAFEGLVVALGSVLLIKTEDSGLLYYDNRAGQMQPPDFRIVLHDGGQLLVEVKNVPPDRTETQVRTSDMVAAQAYANATGGRLLYAHFWSGMRYWTLVDPTVLRDAGKHQLLTFPDAAKSNNMALLGDALLGSQPPLTLSMIMDPEKEEVVGGADGTEQRKFTTAGAELLSAGKVITDPTEWQLAWFLLWHGGWEPAEEQHFDDQDRLVRRDLVFRPALPDEEAEQQVAQQGFASFGPLSTLYTAHFQLATGNDDGGIRALREEPEPGMLARLLPDDYWAREDRTLRLWRAILAPS